MITRIRSFGARRVAVIALAAGLVGVAAVPTMLAASAPPAASPSVDAVLLAPDRAARVGRIMRGDATVLKRDGTTVTVHFERGEISAASATSVTIKGADGVSTTFEIGADTRIRSARQPVTADALKVGMFAAAIGTPSSPGYDALLIRLRPAASTN
jgi:hypothetical protein